MLDATRDLLTARLAFIFFSSVSNFCDDFGKYVQLCEYLFDLLRCYVRNMYYRILVQSQCYAIIHMLIFHDFSSKQIVVNVWFICDHGKRKSAVSCLAAVIGEHFFVGYSGCWITDEASRGLCNHSC